MTGAKQIMQAQAVNNHNIANLSTIGFRADAVSFASQPIYGPGYATRVNAVAGDAGPRRKLPAERQVSSWLRHATLQQVTTSCRTP